MKRFRSYGFWTALAGSVVLLLNSLGECFGFSVNNDLVSSLIMAIAGVLVVLGVVNMPPKDEDGEFDGQDFFEIEEENQENNENTDEKQEKNDESQETTEDEQ